jgi:trk system potassium uptake protein TrkA
VRRGNVQSVSTLKGIAAEAMELDVGPDSPLAGLALKDADFPKNAVLGALIRNGTVIMPRGRDVVEQGDRAIVFALPEAIPEIERLFA